MAYEVHSIRDITKPHYYPWALGDEVFVNKAGETAKVTDAFWDGNADGGAYSLTYELKTGEGQTISRRLGEILLLNRPCHPRY